MKKLIFRTMAVMLFVCLGLTGFAACKPIDSGDTFTVTYVAGDGTGTAPATEKHAEGETFKVAENSFTYEGHTFETWNDGTKDVAAGETYTMPAKDVTFTAKWTAAAAAEKVTVTFSLGENTTGKAPAAQEVNKNAQITLPEAPAWEGHIFLGWQVGTDKTLRKAGDKIKVSASVTVTAMWEEEVTVTFSLGDNVPGDPPAAQKVAKGGQITLPAAPTRPGYDFVGWMVGSEVKNANETITVSASMTVTAQWETSIVGYWTATGVDGAPFEMDGNVDLEVAVEREGLDHIYVVLRATSGTDVRMWAVYAEKGASAWECEEGSMTLSDSKLHVTLGESEFDLTGRTDFTGKLELTGTYSSQNGYYIDFDQYGYDSGEGYLSDVQIVTVGKYVAVFGFEGEDEEPAYHFVLVAGEEGELDAYASLGYIVSFSACEAREKKIGFTSLELQEEDGKVYLIGKGTFEGYTDSEFLFLMEDHDDDQLKNEAGNAGIGFNLSFYCEGHREYEADWTNVENTAEHGIFMTKLDVTDLNMESYLLLANNSGYGDLKFPAATDQHAAVGVKVFTLKGDAGVFAYLVVGDSSTDWTGITAEVTGMSLALNEDDRVIFTISGTFAGCDADVFVAHLNGIYQNDLPLFYFWGPAASTEKDPDAVATAADGQWSVAFDITDFKDDSGRAICTSVNGESGLNKRSGTEFQFKGIVDQTVVAGERAYSLLLTGGSYGHNTIAIGAPVTVTYDLGEAQGTAPENATVATGANVILAAPEECEGYIFKGWKIGSTDDVQQPGSRLTVSANVTVTAVWAEAVTLTYDLGEIGDEDLETPAPVTVEKGGKVTLAQAPEREGYTFKGWRVGQDLKQANDQVEVSANITVTAEWAFGSVAGIWELTVEGTSYRMYISEAPGGLYVIREVQFNEMTVRQVLYVSAQEDGSWKFGSMYTFNLTDEGLVVTESSGHEPTIMREHKNFGAEDTVEMPSGAYSYRAEDAAQDAFYVDFDYKAVDLGVGYLNDAELATVGKFVIVLVEQEDGTKLGPVLDYVDGALTVSNGGIEDQEDAMTLTSTTARAKVFGADNHADATKVAMKYELKIEGEKVYLYVYGTYEGYKPSELLQLCEDVDVNVANISIYPNISPWNPIYPDPRASNYNYIERTHVVGEGKITAKLDVTTVPYATYGIASQNDGYGDLLWAKDQVQNEAQSVALNGKTYALGSNGDNVQLAITPDWTGVTATVTSIALGLDNDDPDQATKVLLTYEGTYSGCTKEVMKGLLEAKYGGNTFFYFWGATSHADPVKDFTVTVEDDGTWKIVIDVTELPVEGCRNLCGFSGMASESSPKMADLNATVYGDSIVHVNEITFNGKTYSLVLSNGWGNLGLNVAAVAAE